MKVLLLNLPPYYNDVMTTASFSKLSNPGLVPMLSRSSVMKSNLGPGVSPKAAKTLFLLCSFQVTRSRCRLSSVQQTSSTPIFLIMLNGPPHCTNVLLQFLTGHHLLGAKITRPSLKSSSYPYRRQLLFISLIIICDGLSTLMPLIMLWVCSVPNLQ